MLVILYHVLREKKPYTDLGADYFAKLDVARIERQAVRSLEQLGYAVTLTPKEQESAWVAINDFLSNFRRSIYSQNASSCDGILAIAFRMARLMGTRSRKARR